MAGFHPTFIDLFSGCGGLSLGLLNAGWRGLFAIEQNPEAFRTLRHNLIEELDHNARKPHFDWPIWLEKDPHEISKFIRSKRPQLKELRGEVHLVAGGPPCQGFSFAGRRTGNDPRNDLFKFHLEIVNILQPLLVLIENVQGINTVFGSKQKQKNNKAGRPRKSYASRIWDRLEEDGYLVQQHVIKAVDFGVPQYRPRHFTLGIRGDCLGHISKLNLKEVLFSMRTGFLQRRGLPTCHVTVSDAISDLRTEGKELVDCIEKESLPGYKEILYEQPLTSYQKLMHSEMNGTKLNSLRLVNHRPKTLERFQEILNTCRKGVQLTDEERAHFGIRKKAVTPLDPAKPSHTITTLPDDFLHYAEPRVHTVREHARLQSFPDWFEFIGKYTTGGSLRAKQCPRYTQVGNAVPPLFGEAIGEALSRILGEL
jgi:DNA (cytosine-5)-methyltransferase 1